MERPSRTPDPMQDPAFRRAYEDEALTLTKLIPTLCHCPSSALMALMCTAASVVLTSEPDHSEARKVMIGAVNLIFDAWAKHGGDLATMSTKGEG